MTLPTCDLAAMTDTALREEIRVCAKYTGPVHPADISPFDPLYRGYEAAAGADRSRVDAVFDAALLDPDVDLRLAAIRHVRRSGCVEKLVAAMRARPELFDDEIGTLESYTVRAEAFLALTQAADDASGPEILGLITTHGLGSRPIPGSVGSFAGRFGVRAVEAIAVQARDAELVEDFVRSAGYVLGRDPARRAEIDAAVADWPPALQRAFAQGATAAAEYLQSLGR